MTTFDYSVRSVEDYDASPADADCYTPTQIKAYNDGDWSYVGLIVTASLDGVALGTASLWGIEHGRFTVTDEDDNVIAVRWLEPEFDESYVSELRFEAGDEAEMMLARLCAARS